MRNNELKKSTRNSHRTPRITRRNLSLEPLESRSMLSVNVLGYHYNNASTGVNPNETILTPSNVNTNTFGKLFSAPTDGYAYASPLILTGVNIQTSTVSGVHDVAYQATENDSLYAIDANTGTQLWKDSFLVPGPGVTSVVPVPFTDVGAPDVSPIMGITSTPVIDPTRTTLYVVAYTKELVGTDTHYVYRLHAIDVTNGNEKFGGPVVIADTICNNPTATTPTYVFVSGPVVNGTGDGGTTVHFNALRELQRPALSLVNGSVYIGFGSHGDVEPYYGWTLGYNAQTLSLNGVFNAAPNGNSPNGGASSLWQGGGQIASDANGALYFMTGNGTFDTTLNAAGFPINGDYGDSFVKIVVDPTTNSSNMNQNGWGLKVADYFTPDDEVTLNNNDKDLGSGAPLLLPDSVGTAQHPHLLVGGGKDGRIFLIDRDNMGHFDPAANHVVQEVDNALSGGSFDTPAYFNNTIYYVESGSAGVAKAKAFAISNGAITPSPTSTSTPTDNYSFPGSTPVISADGANNGVVWTVDINSGQMRAYDATSFAKLLYTTAQAANNRDKLGSPIKFAPVTEANGMVYAGTQNTLVGYGILPNTLPAAPSNVQAVSVAINQATLSWNDNSSNETGFNIYRQTNSSGPFVLVATLPPNSTSTDSHTDSSLQPGTFYTYHIQSFDNLGAAGYGSVSLTTLPSGPLQADLQITNTDHQVTVAPGALVSYSIVVTNAGPNNVTGASVSDAFPAILSGVTYTATATGGATGFTASGNGNIGDSLNLPAGATVTYVVHATLSPTATGNLTDTATITAPAGVTDPNPANNSATDIDTTSSVTPVLNFPNGFASAASQLQLNGTVTKIVGTSLQLTDDNKTEKASVFSFNPVSVTNFATQFNIQMVGAPNTTLADGMTFTIQGVSNTALGSTGSGLGYAGIAKSVAVKFDLYSNSGEGPDSTGLFINGAQPTSVGSIDLTGTGIDLHSGHVFNVGMNYNGTTLQVTITDTTTLATATQSYNVNIPSIVGGNTAYVGFTAGTGGFRSTQSVLSWTYSVGTALAAHTNLAVTAASAAKVSLSWTNVDPNVKSVLIERKTGASGNYAQIGATTTAAASTHTAAFHFIRPE